MEAEEPDVNFIVMAGGTDFVLKLFADHVADAGTPFVYQLVEVAEGTPIEEDVGDAIVERLLRGHAFARLCCRVKPSRRIGYPNSDQDLLDLERGFGEARQIGLVPRVGPVRHVLPRDIRCAGCAGLSGQRIAVGVDRVVLVTQAIREQEVLLRAERC